jgi:hypothetical protein
MLRVLVALALVASLTIVDAGPAAAAGNVGYVRLAHLSPDSPEVDVYVSAVGSDDEPQVFPGVGYGVVSAYQELPAGTYAVAMRAHGAPASEKPILTTTVEVQAGQAYTVAGVGRHADLGLRVIPDDLTAPADGQARLRVVHASLKALRVRVSYGSGKVLADNLEFPSTTAYHALPAGAVTLHLRPLPSDSETTTGVRLAAGSVYSLFVLDAPDGLRVQLRADARGGSVVPVGGVETGAGGTAPSDGRGPLLAVAGLAVVLIAALAARRLRHVLARP